MIRHTGLAKWRAAFGFRGTPEGRVPEPPAALGFIALVAVLFFYGAIRLQGLLGEHGVLAAEWLLSGDEARNREIGKEWYAEIIKDFRSYATVQPNFYHVESGRSRNVYEHRLAGIQFHQGGWHIEYVWVTQD